MDRTSKHRCRTALMVVTVLALASLSARHRAAAQDKPADVPADKSGGLFPNDAGPSEIDVSAYPKDIRRGYLLFTGKCNACHTIARPINAQFLELTPEELAAAKKDDPELFKDPKVVMAEEKIWSRYVKRMMLKPGCPVGKDSKKIYEFLAYDSKVRKTGKNAAVWRASRLKLVEDFQKEHPDRYKAVFVSP